MTDAKLRGISNDAARRTAASPRARPGRSGAGDGSPWSHQRRAPTSAHPGSTFLYSTAARRSRAAGRPLAKLAQGKPERQAVASLARRVRQARSMNWSICRCVFHAHERTDDRPRKGERQCRRVISLHHADLRRRAACPATKICVAAVLQRFAGIFCSSAPTALAGVTVARLGCYRLRSGPATEAYLRLTRHRRRHAEGGQVADRDQRRNTRRRKQFEDAATAGVAGRCASHSRA